MKTGDTVKHRPSGETVRVPREQWTPDEIEFDRLVSLMDSRHQMDRIHGRTEWPAFEKQFTKEQLNAMWERIK